MKIRNIFVIVINLIEYRENDGFISNQSLLNKIICSQHGSVCFSKLNLVKYTFNLLIYWSILWQLKERYPLLNRMLLKKM